MSGSAGDQPTVVIAQHDRAAKGPRGLAWPGSRLGRFVVIEVIGRGGMGVVLRAYDPSLQREVALKIVRTDLLHASAHARLVAEARAMARLSHPNVVPVYDVYVDGQPPANGVVLVMEYVPGKNLRAWLDASPRPQWVVLDAFLAAGRGLAAAHAEGLLHRDCKPTNMLVGDDGRVRMTDFGLARGALVHPSDVVAPHGVPTDRHDALAQDLTEDGTVVGTPAYMAPEQHEGGELDARADQYAFCVSVWEALARRRPFEGTSNDIARAKLAGPPEWPRDQVVPRHIVLALRRGLAPTPADRWPTMAELLDELARDPRRTRRRTISVVAVAVAGVGAWSWHELAQHRTLAACASLGDRIDEVWPASRGDEIAAAFAATALSYAPDSWSRSRARLDAHAEEWRRTRTRACELVEIEGALPHDLGEASAACLDEHRDALDALLQQLATPDATAVQQAATATASLPRLHPCLDEATLRRRAALEAEPSARDAVARVRAELARSGAARATGRYEAARSHARAALDDATALGWTPLVVDADVALGDALRADGRYEEAREALEAAFFAGSAAGADEAALRAAVMLVSVVGDRLARHDDGERWGRLAYTLVDRLAIPEDSAVATLSSNLGSIRLARGEYTSAEELERRALEIRERVLGPDHPGVAASLQNLGNAIYRQGRHDEAGEHYRRALAIREQALGPEHPDVAAALLGIGSVHLARRDYQAARPPYERALAIKEAALGSDHPDLASSLMNLANVHMQSGHPALAKPLLERAVAIQERALGPDHPAAAMTLNNLGNALAALGERDRAMEAYQRALGLKERALGPAHPEVATLLHNLARLEHAKGGARRAAELLSRALAILESSDVPASHLASTRLELARALWDAGGEHERARALATAALDGYRSLGAAGEAGSTDAARWLAERSR